MRNCRYKGTPSATTAGFNQNSIKEPASRNICQFQKTNQQGNRYQYRIKNNQTCFFLQLFGKKKESKRNGEQKEFTF